MRLTLRTMLAWRAGLLPPEAAADIERQIHRGKAATFLLAQVDAFSTRPPRVAMTWLAKGGVTESDVTDYLRNRLREDRLVAFEKACLESENLLAHVVWRHRQLVEARRDSSRQIPPSLDGQPISLRPSDRDDRAAAFEKSLLDSLDVIATAQRDGIPRPFRMLGRGTVPNSVRIPSRNRTCLSRVISSGRRSGRRSKSICFVAAWTGGGARQPASWWSSARFSS